MNQIAERPAGSTALWLKMELRRAIVEMDLVPGTRLSEHDIAERYAVSRQPVREALIALAGIGLVDIRPQRGTFVSLLSLGRLHESRVLREALELMIIRHACADFDYSVVPEIEANLDQQLLYAKYSDRQAYRLVDARFHDLIARGAGFFHVTETLNGLKLHTDRICKLTLTGSDTVSRLTEQHRGIFAAVLDGDVKLATERMHQHLSDILDFLPKVQATHPDWFLQEKTVPKLKVIPGTTV
ncbi:GntR Transcriptional regulators [Rhabdaerophilaceae bacterium]